MKVRHALLLAFEFSFVVVQSANAHAALLPGSSNNTVVRQQASSTISSNEASMILLLRYIQGAEATFWSTTGAGRFGTLQELYLARLIDVKVRTGVKDGYRFVLSVSNPTNTLRIPHSAAFSRRPGLRIDCTVPAACQRRFIPRMPSNNSWANRGLPKR